MRLSSIVPFSVLILLMVACASPGGPEQVEAGPPVTVDLSGADPDAAEKVLAMLQRAQADPQDAGSRGELGMAYEINGYKDAAIESYRQAAMLAPDDPRWSYFLGLVTAGTGDLEAAIEAVDRSLEIDDSYVAAHLYRAQWLLDLGRPLEAEQAYRRALELEPASRAGQLGLARAMLFQERYEEAVELLEGQRRQRPNDAYLFQLLGTAYRGMGDLDKAGEALARGRPGDLPTRWPDPRAEDKLRFIAGYGADMLQGEAFLANGQTAEAIAIFEALREQRPDDEQLINNLSVAYRRDGREDEALRILQQNVERFPEYYPFHLNLANLYKQSGELDKALGHAERAIELNPALAEAHLRRGAILIALGRLEEAFQAFETELSYAPDDAIGMIYAGTTANELKRCDRSVYWLERALAIKPEIFPAWIAMGECLARLGEFDSAEAALDRAARIHPDSESVQKARELVADLRSREP
jgi:tetratricopeptide (TPR) repeat protein